MRKYYLFTFLFCVMVSVAPVHAKTRMETPKILGLGANGQLKDQHIFMPIWNPVKKALYYEVKISANKGFKNSNSVIEQTSYSMIESNNFGKAYIKVRAINKNNQKSKWSNTCKVPKVKKRAIKPDSDSMYITSETKNLSAPKSFKVLSVLEDKQNTSVSILGIWKPVKNAICYEVEVASDKDFINSDSWFENSPGMTVPNLLFQATNEPSVLYVKIRAINKQHQAGKWSNVFKISKKITTTN